MFELNRRYRYYSCLFKKILENCVHSVWFGFCRSTVWLSTAPTQPLTHWYQVRCLLQAPIFVKQGQTLVGKVILKSNKRWKRAMLNALQVAIFHWMKTLIMLLYLKNLNLAIALFNIIDVFLFILSSVFRCVHSLQLWNVSMSYLMFWFRCFYSFQFACIVFFWFLSWILVVLI